MSECDIALILSEWRGGHDIQLFGITQRRRGVSEAGRECKAFARRSMRIARRFPVNEGLLVGFPVQGRLVQDHR